MTTLDDVHAALEDLAQIISDHDMSLILATIEEFAAEQVAAVTAKHADECAAKIAQFQFCIDRVAEALGNVCCGGIDSSPEDQMADPHSTTRVLLDAVAAVRAEQNALRSAAEDVVWFDWSDNDADAAKTIDRLRDAVTAANA